MLGLLSLGLAFPPVIEELPEGAMDWTNLELHAYAIGAAPGGSILSFEAMEGEARMQLGPKILRMSRLVRISWDTTGADLLSAATLVADRLDNNLSLWEVEEARYFTSGRVELDATLELQAWLRPALVDLAKGKERAGQPGNPTTGLVIDARGLTVQPALAPRLKDPSGEVLYSVATLTEYAAAQHGPVVYVHDPADPAAVARAGSAPLFVRADQIVDGTDVVLSAADATTVAQLAAAAPFLLHGKVVIVVSP